MKIQNKFILTIFILLSLFTLQSSALTFNNLSFGGTGAVNTGNGYFNDPNAAFNYTGSRNVYLIAEDTQINILEPISYAGGSGGAYTLVNSSLGTIHDAVVHQGYIYFVDGTTLKKRNRLNDNTLCESTDTSAGGCIITIATGVGETLRVLENTLYYTKGTNALRHLDSTDNEVINFALTIPPSAGDAQFKGFTVYRRSGTLTIIYTGWNGASVFSIVCNSTGCSTQTNIVGANQNTWTSAYTTTNNYYYYVYQNGGTNVEEYRYITNNTNHAKDYLPTDTIAQANRIYVGGESTIGLLVFSASVYQTFNADEAGTDSLPLSEGSGIVSYISKTVDVPNPSYYNDSIIPIDVDLKFIISNENHTNYLQSAFWHLHAFDPTGVEVEDHDLPVLCTQTQPWWDPFGVFTLFIVDNVNPWACDGSQTVNYIRSSGQLWTNGTWEVKLTEQIPGTTSILSTDTWNIVNQTSNRSTAIVNPPTGPGLGGNTVNSGSAPLDNVLNFLGITAFWGFVFWLIIVYSVNKASPESTALVAFLAFVAELVIGLFAPYTSFLFAVLIIGVVLIGISKIFNSGSGQKSDK